LGDDLIAALRAAKATKENSKVGLSPESAEETRQTGIGGKDAGTQVTSVYPSSSVGSVEDQLESARILQSEGLIDDAKRSLRRLLIADPRNASARQALQAIHEQELRGLLDGSQIERMGLGSAGRASRDAEEIERRREPRDDVVDILDREFSLGISSEAERQMREPGEGFDRVLSDMETALAGCAGRDRIDVGIAFLEMGSPNVAEHHFRAACGFFQRQAQNEAEGEGAVENRRLLIASTALLAHSQLSTGHALEALYTLQEALKSFSTAALSIGEVELLYLMGRATEAIGRREEALVWYGKVLEAEPGYRDAAFRMARRK
jgi:tetratricopeptide (TPR) repeat protein